MVRRSLLAVLVAALLPAPALAAASAPANDAPSAASDVPPYTAPDGSPGTQQVAADLTRATADRGVPRCLGPASFARTVWFRIPAGLVARRVTVGAVGYTPAPVDVAAFVQPAAGENLRVPNQCDDGSMPDGSSGVTLDVPAERSVLIQIGGRGRAQVTEQTVLSVKTEDLPVFPRPRGDGAGSAPPLRSGAAIPLAGATLSAEDPAQPLCPSHATVWRRLVPRRDGSLLVSLKGMAASTLTVFAGGRPTTANALDCVDRASAGDLQMVVPAQARRPLWFRVGTDRASAGPARLRLDDGTDATVVDGGPGGVDLTPYGPGGGLPDICADADAGLARIVARPRAIEPGRALIGLNVTGSAVCDATLTLSGPKGFSYQRRLVFLPRGRQVLAIPVSGKLAKGHYRLRASGLDLLGHARRVRARFVGDF